MTGLPPMVHWGFWCQRPLLLAQATSLPLSENTKIHLKQKISKRLWYKWFNRVCRKRVCAWTCQFGNYDAKLKSVEWKPMKRTKLSGRGNKGSTKGRGRHQLGRGRFALFSECQSVPRVLLDRSWLISLSIRKAVEVIGSSNALLDEGVSRKPGPQV